MYKKLGSTLGACPAIYNRSMVALLSQEHQNCRSKKVGTSSIPMKTTSQCLYGDSSLTKGH